MPKYPLEPLAELREKKVESAALELAEAVRKREDVARTLRAAESRRDAQARAVAGLRQSERGALGRGELRARDLARADAWGIRIAAERQSLVGAVDHARSVETTALGQERDARGSVAARRAEAQVVAGHRARWDDDARRRLEAREEEASSEAWRPKR
jgi:YscO-like protein